MSRKTRRGRPPGSGPERPDTAAGRVGKAIHEARVKAGLSADACAEAAGLSRAQWYRIEQGEEATEGLFERLLAVSEIVGVAPEKLLRTARGGR